MKLLRTLILRPLFRDPLRTALTILAVALGVAVVVAIDLAGDAATGSFQSSLETLAGKTDLEISANGGIGEQWIGRLAALPINARFAPVMEAQAGIAGIGSVPFYGVDFLAAAEQGGESRDADGPGLRPRDSALPKNHLQARAAPNGATTVREWLLAEAQNPAVAALVVSKPLAVRLKLNAGDSLTVQLGGRAQSFRIAQIANAPSDFLALDIAPAQQALGRYGKLDRIDVTVSPDEDFAHAEAAIRQLLPAAYLIRKPGARGDENQRMLRAFRWNLRVLSYISLVVGAFLIYNTISISVVRRRTEIGVLRALGAGRASIFALFLAEALLLGIAGAALGVLLGRALAGATVQLISGTINAIFTTSRPAPVELSLGEAALGILLGTLAAFASAFGPAREAMGVHPTEAMSRGAREHHARLRWRRGLAWSVILAALAVASAQAAPFRGFPAGGYAAAFLAIGAVALAAPAFVLAVNYATRRLFHRGVEAMLAGRSLVGSLSRTSVVVAALATAIAMMASVGIMVGSFRETVALWLNTQLRADLYVRPADRLAVGSFPPLAPEVIGIVAAAPGVAAVDVFHGLELHYRGERATLGASNTEIVRRYGRLRFLRGEDRDAVLRSLPNHDRAIVSEPFANKFALNAGDRIALPMGAANVALTIAGIYYDYSSSQGLVILDNSTLLKYLPAQPATNAAVYLAPGAYADAVRRQIQLRTAGLGIAVAPNAELRSVSMQVFDRTFAITWGLEAVAIVVAMLGAANALLAVVLDRRRELGMLRYLGASAGQIRGMILAEAGLLGLLASVAGILLGFALSLVLIFVVNKQSFGWTIQFHPPGALLAGAILLIWCVTVLAGLYPARVAARLNPVEVIHEE